jgi:hypothetical protein
MYCMCSCRYSVHSTPSNKQCDFISVYVLVSDVRRENQKTARPRCSGPEITYVQYIPVHMYARRCTPGTNGPRMQNEINDRRRQWFFFQTE